MFFSLHPFKSSTILHFFSNPLVDLLPNKDTHISPPSKPLSPKLSPPTLDANTNSNYPLAIFEMSAPIKDSPPSNIHPPICVSPIE